MIIKMNRMAGSRQILFFQKWIKNVCHALKMCEASEREKFSQ
jgi:hypothetical protein